MKAFFVCCLIGCLAVLAGCGEGGPSKVPVSGTVTMDGKPISGAIVAFHPKASGRPASGMTDPSGVYKLTTDAHGDGALADDYMVTIVRYESKPEDQAAPVAVAKTSDDPYDITDEYPAGYDEMQESEKRASVAKNQLPPQFAQVERSPLKVQVRDGSGDNVIDFELTR